MRFGKLDIATGRIELLDHGYPSKDPSRTSGDKDKPWWAFNYIGGETQTLSCAPGPLCCNHQGNLCQLDLASGKLTNLFGKRDSYGEYYGGANFGNENQGPRHRFGSRAQNLFSGGISGPISGGGPMTFAFRRSSRVFNHILSLGALLCVDSIYGQNIVESTSAEFTANPVRLTDTDVSEFLAVTPRLARAATSAEARHTASKLGAVFIEHFPGEPLLKLIDAPWCKGDFYFIEKCAYALWASNGRLWTKL